MKRLLVVIGSALIGVVLFAAPARAQGGAFDCAQVTEIPQAECEALVAFFESTDGPQWGSDQGGWLQSNTPCIWAGITCNAGHVTSIYMDEPWCREGILNIAGTLPDSALGALAQLEIFDLDHCHVGGAISISAFDGLTHLQILDLSSNRITGPLPEQLEELPSLTDLVLDDNPILDGSLFPEIGRLSNLNYIALGNTSLHGPLAQSMINLQKVDALTFANTHLCAPTNVEFQNWLASVGSTEYDEGADCARLDNATLTVRAMIDGRSQLVLQGNKAYWRHFDYAAPGRHNFINEPTYFNQSLWYPQWPDMPDEENRDCHCDSSVYEGIPTVPDMAQDVTLAPVWVRGSVRIVQQPRADNDFTLIVEFDDDPPLGDDWYTVNLSYQTGEGGPPPANELVNANFEEGTEGWRLFTNGHANYTTVDAAYDGQWAAQLHIVRAGSNVQFFQQGVALAPHQRYRLSFAAYSSNGGDLSVFLHQHDEPYRNYGISGHIVDLSTEWQRFAIEFVTTGFANPVEDGRLRFWLAPFDEDGMTYGIDSVLLEKLADGPGPLPPPVPEPPVPPAPGHCEPTPGNIVQNPGFEDGVSQWHFYSISGGRFTTATAGYECENAARIAIGQDQGRDQLYQTLELEPNTTYRLRFAAYSNKGSGLSLYLHKHRGPYTNYGLNGVHFDLTNQWQVFAVQFTTTGFDTPVNDARLRLAPFNVNGDIFWIDDVVLQKVDDVSAASVDSGWQADQVAISGFFIDNDDEGRLADAWVPEDGDEADTSLYLPLVSR